MIKLFKHLKKSIIPIIFIILLLFVQAYCDLSLPDYTAKIVNVGIQQGGIENAAPNIIRQTEFDKITLLVNDNEREIILDNYRMLSKDNLEKSEWQSLCKDYPLLETETLFELTTENTDTVEQLNSIMGKIEFILVSAQSDPEVMNQLQMMFEVISSTNGVIPEEMQPQLQGVTDKLEAIPDSIISQGAIEFVKTENKEIGLDSGSIQTKYIFSAGIKMLAVALIAVLATILVTLLSSRVAAIFGKKLRDSLFKKVISFSNKEFDKFSTASLITRSTNDIQQVQMFVIFMFRIVVYAPILGIGGVMKALQTDISMSWVIALAIGVIFMIVISLFIVAMPKFKKLQQLVDKLNLVTREILTGLPVIRAFSTEKHEEERFDKANTELTKTNLFVNRVMTIMMPTMMFVLNAVSILIVWVGAGSIDAGTMQVGDLMAFIQYAMQIIMAFLMISMVSIILPRASVSAKRISEVLEHDVDIKDIESPKSFDTSKKGIVEFKNVSFRYPTAKEDVVSKINFTALPGQTTAIIGSTGSGKSTIANLIPRFYDVTEGEILIDNIDIRELSQKDLRDRLGFVPQKGVLFSGTIESNIKYGSSDISDKQAEKAARIAQASSFIEEKELGYQEPISQGGTNVSGGQKQRLSIARAIAKEPDIYVFDDSFSALDYKTDVTLRKALNKEVKDKTMIIVAQRISTIMHAEQIIVLDEGKIAGIGTHRNLLKNCEVYNQIATSQLSKEELENE